MARFYRPPICMGCRLTGFESQGHSLICPRQKINTEVADVYFTQVLLPALPPDSVTVRNNASFHHSPATLNLARRRVATCGAGRPIQTWKYIGRHLVGREHGEWFWRISPDGQPDKNLPKASEWKGPHHATRACLETLKRLRGL